MRERGPSAAIPPSGEYVVIGVATYAPDELALLDDVNAAHSAWSETAHVDVFDVLDCRVSSDFDKFLPGVTDVRRTPIVGVWKDGRLVDHDAGIYRVRKLLANYGILG
jgi:hypothetical protein